MYGGVSMRSILTGLSAALLVIGLAASSWAQNGLERFEKDIKPQLELKKLTYANAAPLGDQGFVLNDVVAVIPANQATGDKESTVKIQKVTVEELDFDRLKKTAKDDEAPRFAKLKLEGMTGDDEMFTALAPYGVPNVPFDVTLDYRIDTAAKVLDLKTLEVNMRGETKLTLALVIDGISDKSGMTGAKDDGKLRSASLIIDDSGLLAKLLTAYAKEEGTKPDEHGAVDAGGHRSLRRAAGAAHPEGAGCRDLLHRRLEGAQGTAGLGPQAREDRGARRPRQGHDARCAHDHLRLHRDLSRHPGGRGQGGRDSGEVNETTRAARRWTSCCRPFRRRRRTPIRRGRSR